jgi:type I restriction enzyme S subunit
MRMFCARVRAITSSYLKYFLDYFDFSEYVQGSTRDKLTQRSMRSIPVLLAPPTEQIEIVRRIEELLGFSDRVERRIETAKNRVESSMSSILAKAFRGELSVNGA